MPVNRKALVERMKAAREGGRVAVKAIQYELPDLRGPAGNAFNLTEKAAHLMRDADIPETVVDEFKREATAGDLESVLVAIEDWFTVMVPETKWTPLGERDIRDFRPAQSEVEDWSEFDGKTQAPDDLDEALATYEATAENDRRIADAQQKINTQVREEFGLGDDEVVIIQIKKVGDKK